MIIFQVHTRGRKNPELDAIRGYDSWYSAWRDFAFGVSYCTSVAYYWIETVHVR